jgi:hypothetical protein
MAIFRALRICANQGRNINPNKLGWKAAEPHGALSGARLPRALLRGTVYPFPLVAASYDSSAYLN